MTGLRIRLTDGANHPVDSTEIAFQMAGEGAFRQAMELGTWGLIEPVMSVEVFLPAEYQSSVNSSLIRRHAVITTVESSSTSDLVTIYAEVGSLFPFLSILFYLLSLKESILLMPASERVLSCVLVLCPCRRH